MSRLQSKAESARTPASSTGEKETSNSTPLLVDAKHVAADLCLSPRTVWSLTNCGALPSHRIGRAVRYCPDELRAWVQAGCPTEPGAADRLRIERQKRVAK